jgi:hypothetical protein
MMKMLRRALEDANASDQTGAEQTIVMKGPLAEVYGRALDVAYAKNDPNADEPAPEDIAAMESQQMDVAELQKLASSIAAADAAPTNNFQTVYGVARDDLNEDVIVDVTTQLADQPDQSEFVLVIDATNPGANGDASSAPQERLEELSSALECMVMAHKGKVFTSLKSYAASRRK